MYIELNPSIAVKDISMNITQQNIYQLFIVVNAIQWQNFASMNWDDLVVILAYFVGKLIISPGCFKKICLARTSMTSYGSKMYTSTHKILFLYFISKLSCPKTAATSQKIAQRLCYNVVDEAENLYKMVIDPNFKIDHCVIDLWLEQSM